MQMQPRMPHRDYIASRRHMFRESTYERVTRRLRDSKPFLLGLAMFDLALVAVLVHEVFWRQ